MTPNLPKRISMFCSECGKNFDHAKSSMVLMNVNNNFGVKNG
jgi:ribosomal protein L44E